MSGRPSTSSNPYAQPVAPTVPPAIHALANPTPQLIDAQLPGYLIPASITVLRDSVRIVMSKKRREEDALREEGLIPSLPMDKGKGRAADLTSEEVDEEVGARLERMGLMVGGYIAEK